MKKILPKILGGFMSLVLLISACMVSVVASETVDTTLDIPDGYAEVDVILNGSTISNITGTTTLAITHERVVSFSNLHLQQGGALPAYIKDYGDNRLVRLNQSENGDDTAEIVLSVADNEAVSFGYMRGVNDADCINAAYYTSPDNVNWRPIAASDSASRELEANTLSSGSVDAWVGVEDIVTDLPEGTRYLKVIVYATESYKWWCSTIDYIRVFDIDPLNDGKFDTRFAGYDTVNKAANIESYANLTNSHLYVSSYNLLEKNGGGFPTYNSNDGNGFATAAPANTANVVLNVDSSLALEIAMVKSTQDQYANTRLNFLYSADNETYYKLPSTAYSLKTSDYKSNGTTALGAYKAYIYRLSDLPEDINYLKVEIIGGATWTNGIDYIYAYDIDIYADGRFDAAFGSGDKVVEKEYFLTNTAINTEGYVVDYSNVAVLSAGLGHRDGNYVKANDANGGYVVIEADADKYYELGLKLSNQHLATAGLNFYISEDNVTYSPLDKAYISAVQEQIDTTAYYFRRYRLANLPEGTKYLKVEIYTPAAWNPGLDYIDVIVDDINDADRFAGFFDGYNAVASKTYFDDNTTDLSYLSGNSNVVLAWAGLGYRDTNYIKATATPDAYVVLPVEDNSALEAGLVYQTAQAANCGLKFYFSADNSVWAQADTINLAVSDNPIAATNNGAAAGRTDCSLRQYRVANLPVGTKFVKIEMYTANVWQPAIEYVDVFDKAEATCDCAVSGGFFYNPITKLVEGYCDSCAKVIARGDANEDGEVNILDLIRTKHYLVNSENVSVNLVTADVNNDGTVQATDLVAIERFILKAIFNFDNV